MSLKYKAITGVKWTTFSAGMNTFLHFIQTAILARLLNPVDFGLMGMIIVVIGFARIFTDVGVSNAIIHHQNTTKEQLSSLYWLNIMAGIVVSFCIIASKSLIADLYNEPRLEDLVIWASLIFVITPFGQQFQFLLQKNLQFNLLALISVLSHFVNGIVAVILAYSGWGVFSLICGQLGNSFTQVLCLTLVSWNHWRPNLHFSAKDLKGYLGFGLFQMGDKTANYFNSYLFQLLIGSLLGAKALGYYSLAHEMVIKPTQVINPIITKVAFPVFSKIQNDMTLMKHGFMKMQRYLSSLNFPATLGIAVVAPLAVPVIYGDQWLPSVFLVQILAIVGLLRSTGNPIGPLLLANGKANWGFYWNIAKMILQFPVLYFGVKWGGTIGGCIALLCLQFLISFFAYMLLVRNILGHCLKEYIGSLWPSLWSSVLMAVCVLLMSILSNSHSQILLLLIQVVFGLFIYSSIIYIFQNSYIYEIKEMIWQKSLKLH